jgi:hypothetical protein
MKGIFSNIAILCIYLKMKVSKRQFLRNSGAPLPDMRDEAISHLRHISVIAR